MRRCVVLLALAGCGGGKDQPPPPPPLAPVPAQAPAAPPATEDAACEKVEFAQSTPLAEASGAAWLPIDGALALVVVGDSGNDGAYAILDPATGQTREQGKLPLGGGSDDLEGVAVRGGLLYGLTSSGWMRVWKRDDAGKRFALVDGPYAIGPVDPHMPHQKMNEKPPKSDGIACLLEKQNCGHDFEGLAIIDPVPAGAACVGFAAAKADGKLFCLVDSGGKLAADPAHTIAIADPSALADVAFDDRGRLWAGANAFGLSVVWRVDGWQDPAHARVTSIGPLGIGFPEVIAVRGDDIYRMSDTGGSPSLMAKFRCRAGTR